MNARPRTGHYMQPQRYGGIYDLHCIIRKETRTTYHIELHPSLCHGEPTIRSVPKAHVIPDEEKSR